MFGEYLTGLYAEAFYDIFGFVLFICIIMYVVWSLQWIPPISHIVKAVRQYFKAPFRESHLIREMIPNNILRFRFYRFLMWGQFFSMLGSYFASFYYTWAALATMFAENLTINRYTTLVILGSMAVFLCVCAAYYMKEANKLARFIYENRE